MSERIEEIREKWEVTQERYTSGGLIGLLYPSFVNEDLPYLLAKLEAAEEMAATCESIWLDGGPDDLGLHSEMCRDALQRYREAGESDE